MLTAKKTRKVIVLGMGNLLLKDEGIGVHVVQTMQGTPSPTGIDMEVIDGGTLPDIVPLEGVDKLIVVDAVNGGGEAGTVYRFHPEDISIESGTATSLHQLSLIENLALMAQFGEIPEEVIIIGIEPQEIDSGLEPSAKLQKLMPRIIEIVMAEVRAEPPIEPEKGEESR
ncbi:hydrogenase maturation protease [Chloroflexota bacterium]